MKVICFFIFAIMACLASAQANNNQKLKNESTENNVQNNYIADFDGDGKDEYYEFNGTMKINTWWEENDDTTYVGTLSYYDGGIQKFKMNIEANISVVKMKYRSYLCLQDRSAVALNCNLIHNGKLVYVGQMDTSGTDGVNFNMIVHKYGTHIVDNVRCGSFEPSYWGYCSQDGSLHEYGGILLSEGMLEKFTNGSKWLEKIKKMGNDNKILSIEDIWYRANGIININISLMDSVDPDGIELRYITLKYSGNKIIGALQEVDNNLDDGFSSEGYYQSALFPSRAVYPLVPDFLKE